MFKRILVPLDESPLAEAILPQVRELARLHEAELVLFLVAITQGFPGAYSSNAVELAGRAENEYLQRVKVRLEGEGLIVFGVVSFGDPAEEILRYAELEGIDLIAMSTHGRTGVGRWVLGSVAEKVLRASCAPLLLVRAPGASSQERQRLLH